MELTEKLHLRKKNLLIYSLRRERSIDLITFLNNDIFRPTMVSMLLGKYNYKDYLKYEITKKTVKYGKRYSSLELEAIQELGETILEIVKEELEDIINIKVDVFVRYTQSGITVDLYRRERW